MTGPPKYTDGKDLLNGGMTGCSRADGACCVVFYKGSATKTKKKQLTTSRRQQKKRLRRRRGRMEGRPFSDVFFFCFFGFLGSISFVVRIFAETSREQGTGFLFFLDLFF